MRPAEACTNLGGVGGRVGGVPEEATLGVAGEVPGGALQGVKVVEPVLVELVPRLAHLPVQPIVQHLGRHCTIRTHPSLS